MKSGFVRNLVALVLTALAIPTLAADETRLKAVVSWDGRGQLFQTGVTDQEFLGVFDGIMYVETSEGALDEAFTECTVKHRLRRGEKRSELTGNCMVVQTQEDSIYAEYDCSGELGACKGNFRITGGTGKFEGITGSSSLVLRSPLRHIAVSMTSSEQMVVRHGVMILPDLSYRISGGGK